MITTSDLEVRAFHHTEPWNDDEMLIVNGRQLIYRWESNDLMVLFPGGHQEPLSSVQSWAAVKLPARVRGWRVYSRN